MAMCTTGFFHCRGEGQPSFWVSRDSAGAGSEKGVPELRKERGSPQSPAPAP